MPIIALQRLARNVTPANAATRMIILLVCSLPCSLSVVWSITGVVSWLVEFWATSVRRRKAVKSAIAWVSPAGTWMIWFLDLEGCSSIVVTSKWDMINWLKLRKGKWYRSSQTFLILTKQPTVSCVSLTNHMSDRPEFNSDYIFAFEEGIENYDNSTLYCISFDWTSYFLHTGESVLGIRFESSIQSLR